MEPVKSRSTSVAYRRQRQIEDCLFENLQHVPYQSISVADICRQVGISRKAFYNYYHDKDACLCAIIDRVLHDTLLRTSQDVPDNASPLEACTVLLERWKEQKPLFDIIVHNNLFLFFLARSTHYILSEDHGILDLLSTSEVKFDADILCCYVSSQVTLMMQWYSRGFDTPAEEMARKYLRLVHFPLIQPPEE